MGVITVANYTNETLSVSVTATGSDFGKGGSENWYSLSPKGGKDTWGSRDTYQLIRFVRSGNPGATAETVLGIPGETANIY